VSVFDRNKNKNVLTYFLISTGIAGVAVVVTATLAVTLVDHIPISLHIPMPLAYFSKCHQQK